MEVTKWLKPSDSGSRIGDRASVQAARDLGLTISREFQMLVDEVIE